MFQKIVTGVLFSIFCWGSNSALELPLLIQDEPSDDSTEEFPKSFRATWDAPEEYLGLRELNIAGSGQFNYAQVKNVIEQIRERIGEEEPIVVIDLREEPHLHINRTHAVSWYGLMNAVNEGKPLHLIQRDEKDRKRSLRIHHSQSFLDLTLLYKKPDLADAATWITRGTVNLLVDTVESEFKLIKSLGVHHVRVPWPDHRLLSNINVDNLVEIYKNMPEETRVLFHCAKGKSRTSMAMVMWDAMRNSQRISLEEILERQGPLLGGVDFSDKADVSKEKEELYAQRKQLLRDFYQYTLEAGPLWEIRFSDWHKGRSERED